MIAPLRLPHYTNKRPPEMNSSQVGPDAQHSSALPRMRFDCSGPAALLDHPLPVCPMHGWSILT